MTGDGTVLRRGWTTGACAAAAATAAACALVRGGVFPDPVEVGLPGGGQVAFALATQAWREGWARAGVVKDAGDDPDVTHGALVEVVVEPLAAGSGVVFAAGAGVGMVTLPGLAVPPGEPAINPVPRRMIFSGLASAGVADALVTVSVEGGERLAERTLNGRLGIVGGLSILGTTGVVVPYSCAAWISSIQRGIDVARAAGLGHLAASTGSTSEAAVRAHHGLAELALIEMGDFVGGTLKYVARHPVEKLTIAGGAAKMAKLAQGRLDLHSKRGALDLAALGRLAEREGASAALARAIGGAPNGAFAYGLAREAGFALGDAVARAAVSVGAPLLAGSMVSLEVLVFDRDGGHLGGASTAGR